MPPLAVLLDEAARRTPARRAALAVLVALTLWNGLSFVQYRLGFVPRGEALNWRQLTLDRLLLPVRLAGRSRALSAPEPPAARP